MAYYVTRKLGNTTYYLSNVQGDKREWSTIKRDAVLFFFNKKQMDRFEQRGLGDIHGQYEVHSGADMHSILNNHPQSILFRK